MVRDGGLREVEEGHQLTDADLPGVPAQHVDQLHANGIPERLRNRCHPLCLSPLDIRIGDRLTARLTGRPLLLRGQLEIDGHRYRYINSNEELQCKILDR